MALGDLGTLGPYRVLKLLGSGGMGMVFQAEDPQLKRQLALKVLKPELGFVAGARDRFLREAQAVAALEHDNVVAIYQVGEVNGLPYLAMPLLKGESLEARLLRSGKFSLTEVVRIGRETAEGLYAAHQRGLIHRDIKPANLWLEEGTGRVKILDFGLARAPTSEDQQLTQPGLVMGTPQYMAPEQANAGEVDHRCDLFSLGCVLYRMATGDMAFKGNTTLAVLRAISDGDYRRPRELNPAMPAELAHLIERLLSTHPRNRPSSAREVADELALIKEAPPPLHEPDSPQATRAGAPPLYASFPPPPPPPPIMPERISPAIGTRFSKPVLIGIGAIMLAVLVVLGFVISGAFRGATEEGKDIDPKLNGDKLIAKGDGLKPSPIPRPEPPFGWEVIHSEKGGYSIWLPGKPRETETNAATGTHVTRQMQWQDKSTNLNYIASVADYGHRIFDDPETALDNARDGGVRASGGELLSEKQITLGRYPGRELRISPGMSKNIIRVRIYIVGSRMYQLMAGGPERVIDGAPAENFFGSFRLE